MVKILLRTILKYPSQDGHMLNGCSIFQKLLQLLLFTASFVLNAVTDILNAISNRLTRISFGLNTTSVSQNRISNTLITIYIGLKPAIDAYHNLLESTKGQDSVARTKQLAGLFKKANDHLNNHLDKLVTRIKRKEPVFYDTYTSARVIQDLGGSRKQEASAEATLG